MKKIIVFLLMFQLVSLATGEQVPFALLKRLLPSNPIILESGAQFGEDTQWMSQMWPQGTIHAFEPLPTSYALLQKVAHLYKNIFCYPLALSNQAGIFNFYVAGGASSLLQPTEHFNNDYFHADLEHPIQVTCITLDTWAQENNIDHIDFMWLDMEGNELNALQGGIEILKTVTAIYTEVNLQPFWHGGVQYEELKQWLEEQGFVEIWQDIVPNWHGNVLFVNTQK